MSLVPLKEMTMLTYACCQLGLGDSHLIGDIVFSLSDIYRGYYMVARRYKFYVRVARTIILATKT